MVDQSEIILAAVNAAGPAPTITNDAGVVVTDEAAWRLAVAERAIQIHSLLNEKSEVARALAQVAAVSKVFTGVLTEVSKEPTSQRGILILNTGTEKSTDGLPAGHEKARTGRTDSEPLARSLARRAQTLVGRKVKVYIEMEKMANGSGHEARVVRNIEDLGPAA